MRSPDGDDPKATTTAIVGGVFSLLFVVVVVALVAYYNRSERLEFEAKVVRRPVEALARHRAEQASRLAEYRWIDREQGKVAVPIERAMEIVVREHASSGAGSEGGS